MWNIWKSTPLSMCIRSSTEFTRITALIIIGSHSILIGISYTMPCDISLWSIFFLEINASIKNVFSTSWMDKEILPVKKSHISYNIILWMISEVIRCLFTLMSISIFENWLLLLSLGCWKRMVQIMVSHDIL